MFHKMCSYFRVYISSPSYHWWWSGFHGDTRYSWSGAWVHVLLSNTLAQIDSREGECGGGSSVVGGRCALCLGTEICFWAESPPPHPPPSACSQTQLAVSRPFCKGPCLEFSNSGRTNKVRVHSRIKMILFSFLDSGPTQQHFITMHKVTIYFCSQVTRLDSLSQCFPKWRAVLS